MTIPEIRVNEAFDLPARGSWPASRHIFDQESADAILMAWAAERPLLVRGEPGTGKSQLARAAAEEWKRLFVSEVVHSRTEPQDLQWHFDAIGRLGEAQASGLRAAAPGGAEESSEADPLDPRRFLNPGVLWWVFDWASAMEQHNQFSRQKLYKPSEPTGWKPAKGCVLLIDEIDKAEADVPNSLLEVLGNRGFSVPWIENPIGGRKDTPTPLVIITTNEDRELPPAFVRRCLVLTLKLPGDLGTWLCERGRIHFPDAKKCSDKVLAKAADQLAIDRKEAQRQGVTPPGQAEYLDLLKALTTLHRSEKAQLEKLESLSRFALKKYPQ